MTYMRRILVLLILSHAKVYGQNTYAIPFQTESDCTTSEFYNVATLTCELCPQNRTQNLIDKTTCSCINGFRMDINNPRSLQCIRCTGANETPTSDGYFCTTCGGGSNLSSGTCSCNIGSSLVQYLSDGNISSSSSCTQCSEFSTPTNLQRCVPCPECCNSNPGNKFGELCFSSATKTLIDSAQISISAIDSDFLNTGNVQAAYGACSDNNAINQTACEQLANMCVMENYEQVTLTTSNACGALARIEQTRSLVPGRIEWRVDLPWIQYSTTASPSPIADTGISTVFAFSGQSTNYWVAKYQANGTYMGLTKITGGVLQLCKDTPNKMDAAYAFGTSYRSSCSFDANVLWSNENNANIFFELFFEDGNNLYPIPVRVSGLSNQLVRRFYLIDNIRNKVGSTNANTVYYARSMSLSIQLQLDSSPAGKIFPPLLRIEYASVESSFMDQLNPKVVADFSVSYSVSMANYEEFLKVSIPLFGSLAILLSLLETSGWRRREGLQILDFSSLVQFLIIVCANLSNIFFVAMFIYSTVILIFFKSQTTATMYVPTESQELLFLIFTSLAVGFKSIQVLALILSQCSIDIFLIDWEKPRSNGRDQNTISAWRTFFVANEWHEIETVRKINPILQLFAVIFFLDVVGFEQLALMDHSSNLERGGDVYIPEYSSVLRFSVGSFTYLCVATVQIIYFVVIHERFFEDPIRQFVDLCSVANVSVFLLSHRQFGYYIHGRSVHGTADTDMVGMAKMLKREEENIVSKRGLIADSDIQTFEIQVPTRMRIQFDKIYEPLRLLKIQPTARGGQSGDELESSECAKAYNIMRNFLSSFFDHSLRDLDYIVKDKLFLERLLNMEFREPVDKKAYLNNDESGCSFCNVLFYGNEATLLIFEILLFTITDYIAQDFIIAAIVSYIILMILAKLRILLSGYNITKKTLVDSRFLI